MREILPVAARWVAEGRAFAVATVVGIGGSAPREIGASMIVSAEGGVFGNVSGGCVEGVVYERCLEAIAGAPPRVEAFGYSDADAFGVGLTCGGTIEVLVRAVSPGSAAAADLALLAEREQSGVATRYAIAVAGIRLGEGMIDGPDAGGPEWLTLTVGAPARLVIVGAVEFAVALARLGAACGMRVSVVDPRDVFATAARFPGVEVVVDWPDRYLAAQHLDAGTAVCVLTHDERLDVPALRVALDSPVGYVGAMGSRRTVASRRDRMSTAGIPARAQARLRSPIGLDLRGHTPEETALSILAEIVADRYAGTGTRLSGRSGRVHAGPEPVDDRGAAASCSVIADAAHAAP